MDERQLYWQAHFDQRAIQFPEESHKALDFSNPLFHKEVHDLILAEMDFANLRCWLDVGMGRGDLEARAAGHLVPGQTGWIGVDLSFKLLERARLNLASLGAFRHQHLINAAIPHLPFKAGSFDCVVAWGFYSMSTSRRFVSRKCCAS